MSEYYWVDTDKWCLKELVADVVAEGNKVADIIIFQDEEIWVLVRAE